MADSLDKMMYTFVVEDVLKGLFIYVPPGYVACVYDMGRGVLKKVMTPGLHLKIPFWQKAKLFNTQTLEYAINRNFNSENVKGMGDTPIQAQTGDGKKVAIEATVLLRLDVSRIPQIWQTIGEDFVAKIVRPAVQSRFRMVVAKYPASALISDGRDQAENQIKHELEHIFYPRGIFVENVLLSEVGAPHGG